MIRGFSSYPADRLDQGTPPREGRGSGKVAVQPPGFRRCRATDPSPLVRACGPDVANDSFGTTEAPNHLTWLKLVRTAVVDAGEGIAEVVG
jgi:hypothetical protein